MHDDPHDTGAHGHASLPSLRTDGAVFAALEDERRARRARITTTLRFGLLLSIGLLFASCGLIVASGGRGSNGVGQRTAAWVELAQIDAELDCRHTPVASVHRACLAPARKLGEDWDRDPTPPAWVLFGDRLARFFGLSRGVMETGGVLEPALAIRLVRGSLLMRHARGLPPIALVNDARDRLAILDENTPHMLFADPGVFTFLRGALHDPIARRRALTVLLDERLRADVDLLSATRFPTSSGRAHAPSDTPRSVLAERLAHLQQFATLDDVARAATAAVVEQDPRFAREAAPRDDGDAADASAVDVFAVALWHARAGGSIPAALRFLDESALTRPLAIARFLAPARASLDEESPGLVLLAASLAERAPDNASPLERTRRLILDLLLASGTGPARGAACERLLERALRGERNVDFAVRPVLGCPVPPDLSARLSALKNPSVDGNGPLLGALAVLYGDALRDQTTDRPRESARAALFQMKTGLQPFVFEREQREEGGLVPSSLRCTIDVDDGCAESMLSSDLRELALWVRAER